MKFSTLIPLSLVLVLLGGCVASIGGRTHRGEPTLGQQLTDLHSARQSGALTDAEYQTQKAKLLGQLHVVPAAPVGPFSATSCCAKAVLAGKTCAHACCVTAARKGELCDKCNPRPPTASH